jgi:hypothetical protein
MQASGTTWEFPGHRELSKEALESNGRLPIYRHHTASPIFLILFCFAFVTLVERFFFTSTCDSKQSSGRADQGVAGRFFGEEGHGHGYGRPDETRLRDGLLNVRRCRVVQRPTCRLGEEEAMMMERCCWSF